MPTPVDVNRLGNALFDLRIACKTLGLPAPEAIVFGDRDAPRKTEAAIDDRALVQVEIFEENGCAVTKVDLMGMRCVAPAQIQQLPNGGFRYV